MNLSWTIAEPLQAAAWPSMKRAKLRMEILEAQLNDCSYGKPTRWVMYYEYEGIREAYHAFGSGILWGRTFDSSGDAVLLTL